MGCDMCFTVSITHTHTSNHIDAITLDPTVLKHMHGQPGYLHSLLHLMMSGMDVEITDVEAILTDMEVTLPGIEVILSRLQITLTDMEVMWTYVETMSSSVVPLYSVMMLIIESR